MRAPVGEVVVIDGLVCKEYAGKTNIHLTKMARVLTELGTQQAEGFGREFKEFLQKEEEGGTGDAEVVVGRYSLVVLERGCLCAWAATPEHDWTPANVPVES